MIVMLLGGLWHGANWTYVAWGGLHGLYLSINHGFRRLSPETSAARFGRAGKVLAWAATLGAVLLAWVFFRSADFTTAFAVLAAMAGRNGITLPSALASLSTLAPSVVAALGVSFGGLSHLAVAEPYNLIWLPAAILLCLAAPNLADWLSAFHLASGAPVEKRATAVIAWRPDLGWGIATGLILAFCVICQQSAAYQQSAVRFLYFQF
jgi:hypothetical protein